MQSIKAHSGVASLRFKTRQNSAPRTRHRGGGEGCKSEIYFYPFSFSCFRVLVESTVHVLVESTVFKSLYSFFFGKPRRGKSINLTLFSTRQNFFTWEKNALENQDEAFASSCRILSTPMAATEIEIIVSVTWWQKMQAEFVYEGLTEVIHNTKSWGSQCNNAIRKC